MNNAKHKPSGESVTAEDACYRHSIRIPGYEKADDFECEGCGVTVRCINFGKAKEVMKVRPAFSTRWSEEGNHLEGCSYRLGEIVENLLLDKQKEDYTPGPVTFTLGSKPILKKGSSSSSNVEVFQKEREIVPKRLNKRRHALHRMEDLLWLPESELDLISEHPNVHIRTPRGTFLSKDYVRAVNKTSWERGHGVIYGKAYLDRRSGSKVDYIAITFAKTDMHGRKVKGNLFLNSFTDDQKLQAVLKDLGNHPYQVALWWSDPEVPNPEEYIRMKSAQVWIRKIRAIAVKTN